MEVMGCVNNNTLFVNLSGELDEHSAGYVKKKFDYFLESNLFKKVIVDLVDLSFMDSTGIGVLIGRYKNLKCRNIPIFIANPNSHVDKFVVPKKTDDINKIHEVASKIFIEQKIKSIIILPFMMALRYHQKPSNGDRLMKM